MELFGHVRFGCTDSFDCAKIAVNKDKKLGECMIPGPIVVRKDFKFILTMSWFSLNSSACKSLKWVSSATFTLLSFKVRVGCGAKSV